MHTHIYINKELHAYRKCTCVPKDAPAVDVGLSEILKMGYPKFQGSRTASGMVLHPPKLQKSRQLGLVYNSVHFLLEHGLNPHQEIIVAHSHSISMYIP